MVGDRDLVAGEDRNAAPGRHRVAVDVDALAGRGRGCCTPGRRRRWPWGGPGRTWAPSRPSASSSSRSSGVGGPERVWMRCFRSALWSSPKSRLLTSSCSWRSRRASMVSRSCSSIWFIGLVVEVGDAGVDAQHGLGDAQLVLAGVEVVVDERAGQVGLADVTRGQGDGGLAALVLGLASARRGTRSTWAAQGVGLGRRRPRTRACVRVSTVAAGDRLDGVVPVVLRLDDGPVAEVVAVGQHARARSRRRTCRAPILLELAVGDEADESAGWPASTMTSPGGELALDEAVGQRGEHLDVVVAAQQRQLAQLLGDDPDLGAGGGERHPAVAHGVAQAAVDPEGAALHLDPRQHPQQPPRGDPLHLRAATSWWWPGCGPPAVLRLSLPCPFWPFWEISSGSAGWSGSVVTSVTTRTSSSSHVADRNTNRGLHVRLKARMIRRAIESRDHAPENAFRKSPAQPGEPLRSEVTHEHVNCTSMLR